MPLPETPLAGDPGHLSAHAALHVLHNVYEGTNPANFVLLDGTRPFTAVQSGVTPTAAAHLATKGYVDTGDTLKRIARVNTSAVANVDIALPSSAEYDTAILDIRRWGTVPNNATMQALVSTDGGTTFITTASYWYALTYQRAGSAVVDASNYSVGNMLLSDVQASTYARSASLRLVIPLAAGRFRMFGEGVSFPEVSPYYQGARVHVAAGYQADTAVTHLRFQITDGTNFDPFQYSLYGLAV